MVLSERWKCGCLGDTGTPIWKEVSSYGGCAERMRDGEKENFKQEERIWWFAVGNE